MNLITAAFPQKTALSINNHPISFAELTHEVAATAKLVKKLPPGILILNAEPRLHFVIQLLAALAVQKPIALFNHQLSSAEKQTRLDLLGTAITIDESTHFKELYPNQRIKYHPQLALVLFTSGSTGEVKAVQLSLSNILANCQAVITALHFSKVEDQLLFLPLSYSFGLLGQLLPALLAGVSTYLTGEFTDIKALLQGAPVPQMWSGVPSHWVAINRIAAAYPAGAAQIKSVISAGAPLNVSLRKELKHTFANATVYNNYGLTEASPRVLTYSSEDPLFFEDYAGYPIGDWMVKLSEDQELLIQGKQMMLGYLNDRHDNRIQDGWLHTGDLAELLDSGLIAISGRKDHLVNIAGEKVSINAVEQKIAQLIEITELIVLPQSDALYGVRLLICLEKNPMLDAGKNLVMAEKIRHHLLPKKLPLSVHILDSLPRNAHGKLDRNALLASIAWFPKEGDHVDQQNP